MSTSEVKLRWLLFGQRLGKFGLPFILTSGHNDTQLLYSYQHFSNVKVSLMDCITPVTQPQKILQNIFLYKVGNNLQQLFGRKLRQKVLQNRPLVQS